MAFVFLDIIYLIIFILVILVILSLIIFPIVWLLYKLFVYLRIYKKIPDKLKEVKNAIEKEESRREINNFTSPRDSTKREFGVRRIEEATDKTRLSTSSMGNPKRIKLD
jgi:predicted Holliday junction resolvase-like endonuclease